MSRYTNEIDSLVEILNPDGCNLEDRYILKEAINALPCKHRRALLLFAMGNTQEEIGKELGVNQQRVSKILNESVVKIRIFGTG